MEKRGKRILVAVDGSPTALDLIETAVDIARGARGKIRLVQALSARAEFPPSGLFLAPVASSPVDTVARVHGLMADLERQIPEEQRDGIAVEVGRPAEVIRRAARAYGADLVVIGAHRYGRLARALGTNAANIVDTIDRPVLVVRPMPDSAKTVDTGGEDALRPDTVDMGETDRSAPSSARTRFRA